MLVYSPPIFLASSRASRPSAFAILRSATASQQRPPCFQFGFARPVGAPPPAPCIRQTVHPRTAGARQVRPERFDLAVQRGAQWALCMGLASGFDAPPPPALQFVDAGIFLPPPVPEAILPDLDTTPSPWSRQPRQSLARHRSPSRAPPSPLAVPSSDSV